MQTGRSDHIDQCNEARQFNLAVAAAFLARARVWSISTVSAIA
jgi:hypothetical protein